MAVAEVARHAARASRGAGKVEVMGRAFGVNKSQPSRWNNGATRGPIYAMFLALAQQMEKAGADSIPMLGEAKVMGFLDEILKNNDNKEIIVGFYKQRDEIEPLKEMQEQVAARGECIERYEEALIASANAEYRLAAYIAAARKREIDLTRYDKFGNVKVRPR